MWALSLYQPWASLIVYGHKRIETRSWSTTYRGTLLIHASKTKRGMAELPHLQQQYAGLHGLTQAHYPFGAFVGSVEVIDCLTTGAVFERMDVPPHEITFGDFSPGRYGWILRNPVVFPSPVYCAGHLGLWEVPTAILQQIDGYVQDDGGVRHCSFRGL